MTQEQVRFSDNNGTLISYNNRNTVPSPMIHLLPFVIGIEAVKNNGREEIIENHQLLNQKNMCGISITLRQF